MGVPLLLTEDGVTLDTEFGFGLFAEGLWEVPVLPVFPGFTYPKMESPTWSNLRQKSISGKITSIGEYVYPTKTYKLPISVLRENLTFAERKQLEDFFAQCNGGLYSFYFNDVDDNTAVKQLFGIGDGTTTAFQLARALADDGFYAQIQFPVPYVAPTVYVDDVATGAFTQSNAGIINFTSAPSAGATLTWSGNYYWLCQFDQDALQFSKDMFWIWSLKELAFTTVPL